MLFKDWEKLLAGLSLGTANRILYQIFDIVSNVSIVLSCHENQIVSFEYSNDNEQIDISTCDSFESKPHEYNEGDKEGLYEHNWSNKFLQQLLPEINILSSFLNLDLQKILNNLWSTLKSVKEAHNNLQFCR